MQLTLTSLPPAPLPHRLCSKGPVSAEGCPLFNGGEGSSQHQPEHRKWASWGLLSVSNFSPHILLQDGWITKGPWWERQALDPSTDLWVRSPSELRLVCTHPSGASDTFASAPTAPEDPHGPASRPHWKMVGRTSLHKSPGKYTDSGNFVLIFVPTQNVNVPQGFH